ncbi:hypothetical protein [Pseudooceanicola batsensis]|uniref:hypothetical protein n=1 Tax=Pseudooceanicola batsensis TaxID=314255 RepID=UPI0002ECF4D7|nr:hypothetical protein [Pseudooceanicola batsensis]
MTKSNERKLTIARAMAEATAQEMRQDPSVFVMSRTSPPWRGLWQHPRAAERIRPRAHSRHADL